MGCERPRHIVSKNKQIQIWYCWLRHVSNARVIGVSKLVKATIDIDNIEYNPEKVFIYSDLFETNK